MQAVARMRLEHAMSNNTSESLLHTTRHGPQVTIYFAGRSAQDQADYSFPCHVDILELAKDVNFGVCQAMPMVSKRLLPIQTTKTYTIRVLLAFSEAVYQSWLCDPLML